jgi:hypothetical protein
MTYLYKVLDTPTRLYVKKCSHCELKYFGKTIAEDIESYKGSGVYWQRHLKKHNAKSIHLWNSDWYYDTSIVSFATKFSNINKITESEEWANIAIENGIDGGYLGPAVVNKMKSTKNSKDWKETVGREAAIKISEYRTGKPLSDKTKEKLSILNKGENNGFYGKSHSEEQKEKWKRDRVGYKHTEEAKKKISKANLGENNNFYGKSHSPEMLAYIASKSSEIVQCPHCRKTGGKSGMHRWHFDKCKLKGE